MPPPDVRQEVTEENILQFVAFRVGMQSFAVEIHRIKEVLPYRTITSLPKAPSFLEGVIDLRGSLIPILDLRKRLGIAEIRNDAQTRILVLRIKRQKLGLVVDSVLRVLAVPVENIDPPPPVAQEKEASYVLAVARCQDELYVVLDPESFLAAEERISVEDLLNQTLS